jgi:hypothetical protein
MADFSHGKIILKKSSAADSIQAKSMLNALELVCDSHEVALNFGDSDYCIGFMVIVMINSSNLGGQTVRTIDDSGINSNNETYRLSTKGWINGYLFDIH